MLKKRKIKANVYLHQKDDYARTVHIDVEAPELSKIIKPGETTFAAGKRGGFFVGLRKEMIFWKAELSEIPKSFAL